MVQASEEVRINDFLVASTSSHLYPTYARSLLDWQWVEHAARCTYYPLHEFSFRCAIQLDSTMQRERESSGDSRYHLLRLIACVDIGFTFRYSSS